jgi:phosphoglycerate dehydrogenase-like enzyme
VESGVIVSNTRVVFEQPIAEYVVALLLAFAKDIPRTLALQAQRRWVHRDTEMLAGRKALILGAGPIAREVASLLRGVG